MHNGPGITHSVDGRGILQVTIDLPGERVNLLGTALLEELSRLLDQARDAEEVRAGQVLVVVR